MIGPNPRVTLGPLDTCGDRVAAWAERNLGPDFADNKFRDGTAFEAPKDFARRCREFVWQMASKQSIPEGATTWQILDTYNWAVSLARWIVENENAVDPDRRPVPSHQESQHASKAQAMVDRGQQGFK